MSATSPAEARRRRRPYLGPESATDVRQWGFCPRCDGLAHLPTGCKRCRTTTSNLWTDPIPPAERALLKLELGKQQGHHETLRPDLWGTCRRCRHRGYLGSPESPFGGPDVLTDTCSACRKTQHAARANEIERENERELAREKERQHAREGARKHAEHQQACAARRRRKRLAKHLPTRRLGRRQLAARQIILDKASHRHEFTVGCDQIAGRLRTDPANAAHTMTGLQGRWLEKIDNLPPRPFVNASMRPDGKIDRAPGLEGARIFRIAGLDQVEWEAWGGTDHTYGVENSQTQTRPVPKKLSDGRCSTLRSEIGMTWRFGWVDVACEAGPPTPNSTICSTATSRRCLRLPAGSTRRGRLPPPPGVCGVAMTRPVIGRGLVPVSTLKPVRVKMHTGSRSHNSLMSLGSTGGTTCQSSKTPLH